MNKFYLISILFSIILTINGVPLEPSKSSNQPISIVDIPANGPEIEKESGEKVITEDKINPIKEETEVITDEGYGNRRPTILIIQQRRPMFPFFTNPFNTRVTGFPTIHRPSFFSPGSEEVDDEVDKIVPSNKFDMDSVMTRLHSQMSSLWDTLLAPPRRPPVNKDSSEEQDKPPRPSFLTPVFPSFNFPQFQFPRYPSFPSIFNGEKEDNGTSFDSFLPEDLTNSTTSETKIVDGHVVTVNKTVNTIRGSDNKPTGFFQFQVINVRPTPAAATPTPTSTDKTTAVTIPDYDSTKTGDKKVETEIIPNPDSNELFEEPKEDRKESPLFSFRSSIKSPRSLSSDLRVNKYKLENSHEPYLLIDPDVELI